MRSQAATMLLLLVAVLCYGAVWGRVVPKTDDGQEIVVHW